MKNRLEAAIINLDSILAKTDSQQAQAWKVMLDAYNTQRKTNGMEPFDPFKIEKDYSAFTEGIPSHNAIENFLRSHNINLPFGNAADDPGKETICGLIKWKNKIFNDIIDHQGVEVYKKNLDEVKEWRSRGLKTAVVSSRDNCKHILEVAGIENLFDVWVGNEVSMERPVKEKSEPDMYLEAAKELHVDPSSAVIVEESLAGVEAGKRGHFALVVGLQKSASKDQLLKKGADRVVESLDQLMLSAKPLAAAKDLPSLKKEFHFLKQEFHIRELCIFLDYDGTLTPIVERYEDAFLSPQMKITIEKLSGKFPVAVISGRDLKDIQQRVSLKNIYYSGSHGFEMSGPNHFYKENLEAQKSLSAFDEIENILKNKLGLIEGVRIERKKYAMAIHYRQVAEEFQGDVVDLVEETTSEFDSVKIGRGKKVVEVKPNVDWDKGKCVNMLLNEMSSKGGSFSVIYIGDDITDEDVFRDLQRGISILVGDHGEPTAADYHLNDVDEVKEFLDRLHSW